MAFINLINPQNVNSGIGEVLFIAPLSDFLSLKIPQAPFLFSGAQVMIFDTHEFKPGKNFVQLALAPDKNDLSAKAIGDTGAKKFDQDIKCVLPGSYAEQHEFVKNIMNSPVIALVKDSNCEQGFFYQVGTDCVPAYITTDFSTGTTKDGIKGYNLTVNAKTSQILLYTGEVLLESAAILQTEDGNILLTEDGQSIEV